MKRANTGLSSSARMASKFGIRRRCKIAQWGTPAEGTVEAHGVQGGGAGLIAATARNLQPWEFVVITKAEMRKTIAGMVDTGRFIADAPVCVAVFCRDTKYYIEDGSAAIENILLAAWAHGLGSCWVAGDKKPYAPQIANLLGAPAGFKLVGLVAIGYAAQSPSMPPKRSLAEVLHYEKF